MMSGIVQNFTFEPKSEAEKPDHDPRNYLPGLATHPKDFEVCAVPRELWMGWTFCIGFKETNDDIL